MRDQYAVAGVGRQRDMRHVAQHHVGQRDATPQVVGPNSMPLKHCCVVAEKYGLCRVGVAWPRKPLYWRLTLVLVSPMGIWSATMAVKRMALFLELVRIAF